MPKKQARAKGSTATKKPANVKKAGKETSPSKVMHVEPATLKIPGKLSGDLASHVQRLAAEVESLKAEIRKRPGGGGDNGPSRRDQDKILADRLARLDEKIESLWGRVSDLEEHFEGEGGGGRTREGEFDEAPDRDFYEH